MNTVRRHFALFLGIIFCATMTLPGAGYSAETDEAAALEYLPITQALLIDGIAMKMPAFHDDELSSLKLDDVFQNLPLVPGEALPASGRQISISGGLTLAWKSVSPENDAIVFPNDTAGNTVGYLAFYISSDRWQKAHLKLKTNTELHIALDGQAQTFTSEKNDDGTSTHTGELALPVGKHLVTIKSMGPADLEESRHLMAAMAPGEFAAEGSLSTSINPIQAVDIKKVLDAPRISGMALSPDGDLLAVTQGQYTDGENRETWLEVLRTGDGSVVQSWRGLGAPSNPTWHPTKEHALCWESSTDGKSTIWVFDFDKGTMDAALSGIKDMGRWQWTPDGQSIIYSVSRETKPDERRVKRVLHPADRQPWWRQRSDLMQAFIPGGFTRQLTTGPVSPGGWEISPDGRTLAFFLSEPSITERPFSTSTLWLMDLENLTARELLADPWIGGATFSPDSKTLCLQGSPSAFDGLGRKLPDGVQANDYGGQLYLLEIEEGTPQPISIDLRPDVSGVFWSKADGHIYARCTDTQYNNIYRLNKNGWEKIETGLDSVSDFQLAENNKFAVAQGSSVSTPNRIFTVDTKKNRAELLLDPGKEQYRDIRFGDVANWVAKLPNGEDMDGFVFYPPGFDPEKTYPLIVYYYGGTSPITRDFGGRYPKNIWAGQGYVVYVPNPSGATGYGQEYAARHVNDWGIITAGEVIDGTQAFLAAHPFIDAGRVGCIGASYGGFLTEYILTQTDIFAAGVSHAGISSISSYWGEGMWGYGYGARALAHSFPWKNPELFVNQSALFHADDITTPLLLVHGDADINVPVGESDQLFTALKILGRDVEYVQIVGQDHHILDHEQRIIWNDTILAYFAKYLKGRGQWWDEMYPAPKDFR